MRSGASWYGRVCFGLAGCGKAVKAWLGVVLYGRVWQIRSVPVSRGAQRCGAVWYGRRGAVSPGVAGSVAVWYGMADLARRVGFCSGMEWYVLVWQAGLKTFQNKLEINLECI